MTAASAIEEVTPQSCPWSALQVKRARSPSAGVGPEAVAELDDERLVELERCLDLGDDPVLLRGVQTEGVQAGAVAVLVDLRLRDLREVVERDAGAAELEG